MKFSPVGEIVELANHPRRQTNGDGYYSMSNALAQHGFKAHQGIINDRVGISH
jgi:hypothetical protein